MRKTPIVVAALAAAVAAASAAGAGGSGAVVKTGSSSLGRILVDSKGRALYLFEADRKGRSACYGACAKFWPPLLTTAKPQASTGVKTALLGTLKRTDGKLQVTYAGHPLYLFVKDAKAGQTNGEGSTGFGASWFVLAPSGARIAESAGSAGGGGGYTPPSVTTTPSSGSDPAPGGGYGY